MCKIAGSTLGFKLSEETKQKMCKLRLEEHKLYFKLFGRHRPSATLGHHWKQSKETIEKKSNSLKGNTNGKGKIRSDKVKIKMSNNRKGKHIGADHYKTKPVFQYDKNMNFIKEYVSLTEASKQTKVHLDSICRCALKKYKTGGGFIWRYEKL